MSNIGGYLKQLQHGIVDNSPAILTGIGMVGTVSTAVLSAKAAFRVGKDVDFNQSVDLMAGEEPEVYDAKTLVQTYWKEFVPAMAVGTATVVCIFGANRIASNRTTAAIAAYSFAEKAFGEYREKAIELHGANKDQKVRDSVAADNLEKNPVGDKQVIITGNGDVLCYESLTGRYFESNVEAIRKAVNDINRQINNDMYASLNEFFEKIGLPDTGFGEQLGWNLDKTLEVQFSAILGEDGRPCMHLGYLHTPFPEYHRVL